MSNAACSYGQHSSCLEGCKPPCMPTSRHFNCLPKVAKMVCRGSKHDAVFLLSEYTRLT